MSAKECCSKINVTAVCMDRLPHGVGVLAVVVSTVRSLLSWLRFARAEVAYGWLTGDSERRGDGCGGGVGNRDATVVTMDQ